LRARRARLDLRQHDGRALPPGRKLGRRRRARRRAGRAGRARALLRRGAEARQRRVARAQPRGQPPRAQLALVAADGSARRKTTGQHV